MTNEETNERYALEITPHLVEIWDESQQKTIAGYSGPDRLLAATTELNRLNAVEVATKVATDPGDGTWKPWAPEPQLAAYGSMPTLDQSTLPEPTTPAEFLTKRLPAVARRQRIESHLAEVTEIEEGLVRVLAEDAANLKRATALREKLEKELSGPLSATVRPEIAEGLQSAAEALAEIKADAWQPIERDLFKPQPY